MKIGIIGASFSGMVAGEMLAKAGHDVTVIEKDRALGGRLATAEIDGDFFDYGLPFLTAEGDQFKQFVNELVDKDLFYEWTHQFPLFDGSQFHRVNPNRSKNTYYASKNGLHAITNYLKRWVDVKSKKKAGGLTYIGPDRDKKRPWMINLTDISVFECDAVILATTAVEAYGILQTAQDETPARRIIRVIDEIQYSPRYALSASYEHESPSWKGIECEKSALRWIGNETTKSENQKKTSLVIHSSGGFVRRLAGHPDEEITQRLLDHAAEIGGSWIAHPQKTQLHLWKYYRALNPIDEYFMELEMVEAPLALIGDYFRGFSAESSYVSGRYLADYWINKYESASVNA